MRRTPLPSTTTLHHLFFSGVVKKHFQYFFGGVGWLNIIWDPTFFHPKIQKIPWTVFQDQAFPIKNTISYTYIHIYVIHISNMLISHQPGWPSHRFLMVRSKSGKSENPPGMFETKPVVNHRISTTNLNWCVSAGFRNEPSTVVLDVPRRLMSICKKILYLGGSGRFTSAASCACQILHREFYECLLYSFYMSTSKMQL